MKDWSDIAADINQAKLIAGERQGRTARPKLTRHQIAVARHLSAFPQPTLRRSGEHLFASKGS